MKSDHIKSRPSKDRNVASWIRKPCTGGKELERVGLVLCRKLTRVLEWPLCPLPLNMGSNGTPPVKIGNLLCSLLTMLNGKETGDLSGNWLGSGRQREME